MVSSLAAFHAGGNSLKETNQGITIQEAIDLIIRQCVKHPFPKTVDTVKTGDPAQKLRGIVATFLATRTVIEKAVQLKANLIITHEPTFYNHLDEREKLGTDPVYLSKLRLLEENQIVVWRFHDYWHSHRPDGVMVGVLKQIGWEPFAHKDNPSRCTVAAIPLTQLAKELGRKFQADKVAFVGDPQLTCREVSFSLGAAGGEAQISSLSKTGVDVLVVGELNEWETCEYARDASLAGIKKGLIVLGHAASEEPGMKYLADWLQPMLPGIPIHHIPAGSPFAWI
jgi:putative NIF3 family GTP cyclohydrolase 1 type 2